MSRRRWTTFALAAALALALAPPPAALAQEALNTPAATQPSTGHFVYQSKLRFARYGDDPTGADRSGDDLTFNHRLQYGLSKDWSAQLDVALIRRDVDEPGAERDVEAGLGDATLTFKHRFWQDDFGPVDTARAAVFAGAQLPTGAAAFSSDSVDPVLGAVFMYIGGRHGFNQSASYTLTTGATDGELRPGDSLADLVRFDSAYLYRLSPAEYGSEYVASTYAVLELNGVYETNGDVELLLSPGLLYEGTTWAAEAGVQVPVYRSVDDRPETEWGLVLGLRFLW